MSKDTQYILIMILATILVFVIVVGFTAIYQKIECAAKTQGMGFPVSWSFFGGCRIEVETGKWIPLSSYYFKQP